jgi:hypothetical protein
MSTFRDGPAGGQSLANGRQPLFLRVVVDAAGGVDCLDHLEDVAKPDERIHVYELVPNTDKGIALVRVGGHRGQPATCIPMALGDYRHRPDVDGELVRDTLAWRNWCLEQPPARLWPVGTLRIPGGTCPGCARASHPGLTCDGKTSEEVIEAVWGGPDAPAQAGGLWAGQETGQ